MTEQTVTITQTESEVARIALELYRSSLITSAQLTGVLSAERIAWSHTERGAVSSLLTKLNHASRMAP